MKEPRRRGVRLTDLDRSKRYVIAHTGRRWETVAELTDTGTLEALQLASGSRSDGVASTPPAPGRHVAPGPEAP